MSKSTISLFELFQKFPDHGIARIFLEEKRWSKDDRTCPHYNFDKITTKNGKKLGYFHGQCYLKYFAMRANKIFECSYISLKKFIDGVFRKRLICAYLIMV